MGQCRKIWAIFWVLGCFNKIWSFCTNKLTPKCLLCLVEMLKKHSKLFSLSDSPFPFSSTMHLLLSDILLYGQGAVSFNLHQLRINFLCLLAQRCFQTQNVQWCFHKGKTATWICSRWCGLNLGNFRLLAATVCIARQGHFCVCPPTTWPI